MKYLVTGAAGFVGSHLTDALLGRGHAVVGFDNLSTGQETFLERASQSERFSLVRGDILDGPLLDRALEGGGFSEVESIHRSGSVAWAASPSAAA